MSRFSQKEWVSEPQANDKTLREFASTIQNNLEELWEHAHDHDVVGTDIALAEANRVVVTDDSKVIAVSDITTDELDTLNGITSNIQAQLNGKQATGNYITALTGDVTAAGPGSAAASVVWSVVYAAHVVIRETPSGLVNSSNVTYTLASTPIVGSEEVYLNGLLQAPGAVDYSISGSTITFVSAPLTGDLLRVSYHK